MVDQNVFCVQNVKRATSAGDVVSSVVVKLVRHVTVSRASVHPNALRTDGVLAAC